MIGYIIDNLEIKFINNEIGYGVFTNKKIKKNTVIENAYCISIKVIHKLTPELKKYVYLNRQTNSEIFLALGYGSIYNHSDTPNMEKNIFWNENFIQYKSTKDIEIGEQLTYSYGEHYWESRKIKPILI